MRNEYDGQTDLIDELRMRGWARANHIPAPQRPDSWHPIILDEMRRMDAEVPAPYSPVSTPRIGASYVPVVPTNVYMVHPGHARSEPAFNRDASLTERYVVG